MRVGDPALVLLKPNVRLNSDTERLLRADFLRALPDPTAQWDSPNGYSWIRRGVGWTLFFAAVVGIGFHAKKRLKTSVGVQRARFLNSRSATESIERSTLPEE
jgi:hypothetical protein